MTNVIKPFKILSTREEPQGSTGVTFETWKTVEPAQLKRRQVTMTAYVSVPIGSDADEVVFEYLNSVGWL